MNAIVKFNKFAENADMEKRYFDLLFCHFCTPVTLLECKRYTIGHFDTCQPLGMTIIQLTYNDSCMHCTYYIITENRLKTALKNFITTVLEHDMKI